jgi:hypothetical protein
LPSPSIGGSTLKVKSLADLGHRFEHARATVWFRSKATLRSAMKIDAQSSVTGDPLRRASFAHAGGSTATLATTESFLPLTCPHSIGTRDGWHPWCEQYRRVVVFPCGWCEQETGAKRRQESPHAADSFSRRSGRLSEIEPRRK